MPYVYGLDAGGSKTSCVIADQNGNFKSIGTAGPANYKLVGDNSAQKNLYLAIENAVNNADISMKDLVSGFYAISGYDTETDFKIIDKLVKDISPNQEYQIDNDALASLYLGSSNGDGIVLICGTGSNCLAVNSNKERLQIGGLGREFGDYAGGREIATQALAAAVRGFDGRGPKTALYDYISSYLGYENLAEFEPVLHNNPRSYPLAKLTPLVFSAANAGDKVAKNILTYNGKELALSAKVAINKLFSDQKNVEVVLTGGVFKNESTIIIDTITKELKSILPGVRVIVPKGEPVFGAVIQALRLYGINVTEEIKKMLIEQYLAETEIKK